MSGIETPTWQNKIYKYFRNLGYSLALFGLLNISSPAYTQPNNCKNIPIEQVNSDSNGINQIKLPTIYQNKLALFGLLNVNSPAYTQSNNCKNIPIEQVNSVSNGINQIKLPTIYQNKLDDFLDNNNVMKDSGTKKFTIKFVEKEMEADWGLSKEHQLLFIRHSIYKQVTNQDLYDGKDENQKIAEDFSNRGVSIRIRVCGQKYRDGFTAYMQQRSADADRRSADATRKIMELDSIRIGNNLKEFYDTYIKNPNIVKQEEIDFMKKRTKEVIADCKKYGIDYRAILLKEVGDREKVDEMLRFYGVE